MSHCECWLMERSRNRTRCFFVNSVKQEFRILKEMKSDWVKQPNVLIPLDFCTLKFGFLKLKYQILHPRFHLFKDTLHFCLGVNPRKFKYIPISRSVNILHACLDFTWSTWVVIFKSLGIWKQNNLGWPIILLNMLHVVSKSIQFSLRLVLKSVLKNVK